jgi:hypothetical protein
MATELTWLGHGSWSLRCGHWRVVPIVLEPGGKGVL